MNFANISPLPAGLLPLFKSSFIGDEIEIVSTVIAGEAKDNEVELFRNPSFITLTV